MTVIEHEKKIVWLSDREEYPFLREGNSLTTKHKGVINMDGTCVVGYAEARKNEDGVYLRRFWFVKEYDDDGKYVPCEAVNPLSIKLNENSVRYESTD